MNQILLKSIKKGLPITLSVALFFWIIMISAKVPSLADFKFHLFSGSLLFIASIFMVFIFFQVPYTIYKLYFDKKISKKNLFPKSRTINLLRIFVILLIIAYSGIVVYSILVRKFGFYQFMDLYVIMGGLLVLLFNEKHSKLLIVFNLLFGFALMTLIPILLMQWLETLGESALLFGFILFPVQFGIGLKYVMDSYKLFKFSRIENKL